jgi:hypothetical protein
MPGKHKSPLYKGIGKYTKKAKGQRGFKMTSPLQKNEATRSIDTSGDIDVTNKYKKEGNEKTRKHIAEGGKVIMRGNTIILTSSPKGSATPKASPYKGGWWAKQTKTHGGPS